VLELRHMPQTASMQDIKNRTEAVTKKFDNGPVMLMNRATPQAVIVSLAQWNAIVTLQAELAIATGQSQVETIHDPVAFLNEMLGKHEPIPA
jgi:PHD/YefM family antitoxin component YafN of YafNO toxin-antitoxin module